MHHRKRLTRTDGDEGISPVIGVMLMLVVVIIIAAVVSGYAGGMIGTDKRGAPTLSMDVKIINSGYWHGSGFSATVNGVSEPIPTRDLKIVTSWKHVNNVKTGGATTVADVETGGATTVAAMRKVNVLFAPNVDASASELYVAPFGAGPGTNETGTTPGVDTKATVFSSPWQQFGNYTLMPGTTLTAQPCGADAAGSFGNSGDSNHYGGYGADNKTYDITVPGTTSACYERRYLNGGVWGSWQSWGCCALGDTTCSAYKTYILYLPGGSRYRAATGVQITQVTTPDTIQTQPGTGATKYTYINCGSSCIDPAKALLGTEWNKLRRGDTVNVRVIHIPSGKTIFNQDVPVMEA